MVETSSGACSACARVWGQHQHHHRVGLDEASSLPWELSPGSTLLLDSMLEAEVGLLWMLETNGSCFLPGRRDSVAQLKTRRLSEGLYATQGATWEEHKEMMPRVSL